MSEREENDLIADAVRRFGDAQRRSKLIASRLHTLGFELRQIAEDLSPLDPARKPAWDTLRGKLLFKRPDDALAEILDMAKLRALIDEWSELQPTIERLSDTLRGYGWGED